MYSNITLFSLHSPVSDSVFEETFGNDTEDDMDQFSTDTDVELQNTEFLPLKEIKSRTSRRSNSKTVARVERTAAEVDASTSTNNISIAMQTSFITGLNSDDVDLNQETICEIEEIGPQAQNNNRNAVGGESASQKLFHFSSNSSSNSGSENNNKYSKSTGNMAQETLANKLDKSQFLSEPLNLHYPTVVEQPPPLPSTVPQLHKSNSKTNISTLRMPLKANYYSSSSRSSSSCHSTT